MAAKQTGVHVPSEIGITSASGCHLSSTVPREIVNNLQALQYVKVWYTPNINLQWSIPTEICRMGDLMRLDFSNNNLNGEIHADFGNMENLEILDVSA